MKREILELGEALGCSVRQVQQWGYRGHVPHKWRLPMLKEAAERLVLLSEQDFVWEKVAKRRAGRVLNQAGSEWWEQAAAAKATHPRA